MSRAARVLGLMTAASRVAGLARDVVVGAVLGSGPGADAFFVAFRIPNMLRRVVAEGAASAAFVPVLTGVLEARGRQEAVRAAGAIGGASIVVLAVLTALGMALAGPLTAVFAPGFAAEPAKGDLAAALTRWTFPYLLLVGTAAWSMGVHHTLRRFALPAAGPVLMNVAIIACVLLLAPGMAEPAWSLVAGVLVGGTLQVAVQVPSLARAGLRPWMLAQPRHDAVGSCGRGLAGVLFGGSVYQVNVLLATTFASLLPAGTVSWLWYTDRLLEFPLGIVAAAVGTAALPSLAAQASSRRYDDLADTVVHAMSLTVAFCLPAATGLALLADPITSLLFQRGSFSAHDTTMTAWAVKAATPGLVGVGLVRVLTAAFFAMGLHRVPVAAGGATIVANALLSIALMGPAVALPWWGSEAFATLSGLLGIADLRHAGLSLATGLSATANALLLAWLLRARLPSLRFAPLARSTLLHASAAAAMAVAVAAWSAIAVPWSFAGADAVRVGAGVAVGGAVYVGVALALGSAEVRELLGMAPRRA